VARRRRLNDETQRELLARQGALTSLTKHPAWPDLQAEVMRKRQRIEKLVLAKTIAAKPGTINEPEITWLSGFIAGMEWFSQVPEQAEASLERFLKAQGVALEGVET
jgi:hypothetical protein